MSEAADERPQRSPLLPGDRLSPNLRAFQDENRLLSRTQRSWFIALTIVGFVLFPINWWFSALLRQRKDVYRIWYFFNRLVSWLQLAALLGISTWYLYELHFGRL